MDEERQLSKTEASLGLSFLAALMVGLVWAYVHQLDAPPRVTPKDPNWVSSDSATPGTAARDRAAYR